MDLAAEAVRLQLDTLAVEASGALTAAGVPHALIKGPSTSLWLYDPPRAYSDVDLLVPLSQAGRAAAELETRGIASPRAGAPGEEASHSHLLHAPDGLEIDLHLSLPAVPPSGDRLWRVLSPHVVDLEMDVGTVPALDEPGRCLVLALHALAAPATDPQPHEDLARAWVRCRPEVWEEARHLAGQAEILDLVEGGLAALDTTYRAATRRARLYADDAPAGALGLQRLWEAPRRDLPRLIAKEVRPSRGFMSHAAGVEHLEGRALARAHLRRWRRLLVQLPAATRAWRSPH